MSIELMMPSNHLILCHPLLLLPSIFPSIRVFSTELTVCIRWPKDWNISLNTSPSNEYSELISFRTDWFDLLALCYYQPQNSGGSGSFPVRWFFTSSGQSIEASASASVPLMNIQCWFPLGLTGLISLLSKGLSRVFSTIVRKHQFFGSQPSSWSKSHICTWLLEKP